MTKNEKKSSKNKKSVLITYIFLTIFCIIFDRVYALFGHGVESPYMQWVFVIPLVGLLVLLLLYFPLRKRGKGRFGFNAFNSGIATLTIGSLTEGILEIAGASSPYMKWFLYVGIGFVAIGIVALIYSFFQKKENSFA